MRASRNLKFLAAALAFVVALGTAGFHYIEGWPWFDGFYMVIITLTTIGDQEPIPCHMPGAYSTSSSFWAEFPWCFWSSEA